MGRASCKAVRISQLLYQFAISIRWEGSSIKAIKDARHEVRLTSEHRGGWGPEDAGWIMLHGPEHTVIIKLSLDSTARYCEHYSLLRTSGVLR